MLNGGENSNTTFEYIDFELIKNNPKIFCGYSDITSLSNIINEKTGLITFSGTNFKTIVTDETDFSYNEILNRFCNGSLEFGVNEISKDTTNKNYEEYKIIKKGKDNIIEGELVGGNLSLIKNLTVGEYSMNFKDKILFLEELGFESSPEMVSNYFAFMKQNKVFKQIKGLWFGNYNHETKITIEQILLDIIGDEYDFSIIKSENFGHIETKTVIPIGTNARIDLNEKIKIKLIENCVK